MVEWFRILTTNNMEYIKLYNGVQMPTLGYGVFLVSPEECERCVSDALSVGYRLIDTAQAYQNEEGVGNAWRKSGIKREDLFLVTKVWISNAGEEQAAKSIDESLRKLQTEYIDLLLIHQCEQLPGRPFLRLCPLCRAEAYGEPAGVQHAFSADWN